MYTGEKLYIYNYKGCYKALSDIYASSIILSTKLSNYLISVLKSSLPLEDLHRPLALYLLRGYMLAKVDNPALNLE
jgi:hypothetical protein